MSERHPPLRAVHGTCAALLVLWGASWALSYVDTGRAALPVALGIAGVKAILVASVFMNLARERASARAAAVVALALGLVLVTLVALDVATRGG